MSEAPSSVHAEPAYRNTQGGPWCVPLYGIGVLLLALAVVFRAEPFAAVILLAVGALLVTLGACFTHLTVADAGDRLAIRFGPIPLFARSIRYQDMQSVQRERTMILDSWGVHMSPRGGWVWNIWGRDCVLIRHGGQTWLGTNDLENLLQFLQSKLPAPAGRA